MVALLGPTELRDRYASLSGDGGVRNHRNEEEDDVKENDMRECVGVSLSSSSPSSSPALPECHTEPLMNHIFRPSDCLLGANNEIPVYFLLKQFIPDGSW